MAEKAIEKAAPDVVRGDVLDVLKQIRAGDLVFEMTQELEKVVAGVRETGSGGNLTVKISIAPIKAGSTALNVQGDVTAKIPKPQRDASIFFATEKNTLIRTDPRQRMLPLED
jgi:hypothetical protein